MDILSWDDNRPQPDEYGDFYKGYIDLVTDWNVIQALIQQGQKMYALIQQLSTEQANFRYQDNKWSVRQVIGHVIDTERIMGYRALSISRGEQAALPGYDQDQYVDQAHFENRNLKNLANEYDALRNANIALFNSFSSEQILRKGTANNQTVSVRALAYIIAGHEQHHLNILKNQYKITSLNRTEK